MFVTAYKEFAVEAFELEAFDYILKPYNEPRLISLLQKLELAGKSQTGQGSEPGTPHNRTVNLVKGSASSSPPASRSTTRKPTRSSPMSTPAMIAT